MGRLVVIGGGAAYGMCGIPYFLGGVVPRAESLLAYPPPFAPVYDPVLAVAAKAARAAASTAGPAAEPAASTMGGSS